MTTAVYFDVHEIGADWGELRSVPLAELRTLQKTVMSISSSVNFSDLTAAEQAALERDNAEQDPEDVGPWDAELRASDRPKKLVALLIAFVNALSNAAGKVGGHVELADGAAAREQIATALSIFEAQAEHILHRDAPRIVAALRRYVEDATGGDVLHTQAATDVLLKDLAAYVAKSVEDVKSAAHDAVSIWHATDGTDMQALRAAVQQELVGLDYQVARAARTELQNAYTSMLRTGFADAKVLRVMREAMPTACAWCAAVAGVYAWDDPDLYDSHPNCACVYYAIESKGEEDSGE